MDNIKEVLKGVEELNSYCKNLVSDTLKEHYENMNDETKTLVDEVLNMRISPESAEEQLTRLLDISKKIKSV